MYPYPATHSVILRLSGSGWHINSQNPSDLTNCPVAIFATRREERDRNVCLMLPSYLDSCLGPQAPPSHKACAREENTQIELPELHPSAILSSIFFSGGVFWVVGAKESTTPFALYGQVCLFLSPAESSNMAFPDAPGNFPSPVTPVHLDLFHWQWHCR